MNKGEKEIVELMKEWQQEITKITVDYNKAISSLDKLAESYNRSFFVVYKNFFITAMTVCLLVVLFILVSRTTQWCSLSISWPITINGSDCSK